MTQRLLVGGLGDPHDRLAAAAIRAVGGDAETLGPLDADALDRGLRVLPRGQCAPAAYTTGALLRAVGREPRTGTAPAYVSIQTCGPCRFVLFEDLWRAAFARAGLPPPELVPLDHSAGLVRMLETEAGWVMLEALLAADAIDLALRRLLPHALEAAALERVAARITAEVAERIAAGMAPIAALRPARAALDDVALRPPRALARVVLVGDPWSLHVHGDGQLHLPRVLAAAGCEVEIPPLALWISFVLADAAPPATFRALTSRMAAAYEGAAAALGLGGASLPRVEELAELAAPWIDPALRGGYGPIEVGLGRRAAIERRAHAVISVKSFGCMPSGAVSDAILPAALAGAVPFLSVEVCGDGDAARESRLTMRVAAALEQAEAELDQACRKAGIAAAGAATRARDPRAGAHERGPRPYACTLACDVVEARS